MDYRIWKYEIKIDDKIQIEMPEKAEILSVQVQKGIVCIWALVDSENKTETRYFEVFGTGHKVPVDMGISRKFIGTFQIYGGDLVFHLFERTD